MRVGLAYDVAAIARARRTAELAALSCRMDSQGSVGLAGALARLRDAAMQAGYHARRAVLHRALDEEQAQGRRLEEAHKRGLLSLKALDVHGELEHELAMALASLDPLLRPRALGHAADEPELGDEFVRAALAQARGFDRPNIAAVGGRVLVGNARDNWLTSMHAIKYWIGKEFLKNGERL